MNAPKQEPEDLQRDDTVGGVDDDAGLDAHQADVLLALLRVMYPHSGFPDGPYQRTAQVIQEAEDSDEILPSGLADLDSAAGGDFSSIDEEKATAIALERQGSPLITLVHATAVVALYDDHEVWELLGYEGPSFDKGGYIDRGFDDLDWLPDPRVEEYDGEPRVELVTEEGA